MAEVRYDPALARHFGTWEGSCVYLSPDGEVLDRHNTKLEIGARGKHYSQRNTYTWSDGRQRSFELRGVFDDAGKLCLIESGLLKGECISIGEDIVIFTASYKASGDLENVTVSDP